MGRNGKPFWSRANSRQARELFSKPVVYKHEIFAPGLTDEIYRTCCIMSHSKIKLPKQPEEDMEFGLKGAERYVDGKGDTTANPECRELSCSQRAVTGYNGCCKAHNGAFVNIFGNEAEWERRNENES